MKAEELYKKHYGDSKTLSKDEVINLLKHFALALELMKKDNIEFAKMHVRKALEAALDNIEYQDVYDPKGSAYSWQSNTMRAVKAESILNAYPDELIK